MNMRGLNKLLYHRFLRPWWNCTAHHHCKSSPIKRILIANRGEIACRIIRTARKMGIQTTAVFSDPDRHALHVAMADDAYHIGPAAVQESYLRGEKVMEMAKKSGSHAIHPGYGFLSESTEFADLCEREGVIFIGPPSSAIRDMGIKSTSKYIMSDAGVPIVGGYHGEDQSTEKLMEEALKIGYPVMIKAVRGGGGKGMRIAMNEGEFLEQLNSAKTEGMKSFGDDVMLVEKFVERPRHVEVQVFGDQHDNYVYLFERDCSVQRRHQKIIEEAPAPGVSEDVRRKLGEAAVKAARAVRYVGAGTVEFILDTQFNFYFMEMNTRLQVEHPVSEMITGTDLVEWQIRVAGGERLPVTQEDLAINGHSFEARIYAEDPANNFLPGAGSLERLITPLPEPHIRIETGVREGDEVSVHYDPMIAKLVVWGSDRHTALARLDSALSHFNVVGLSTNIQFLRSLAQHPKFEEGDVHTDFIPQHHRELFAMREPSSTLLCTAALAVILGEEAEGIRRVSKSHDPASPFRPSLRPRFNHTLLRQLCLVLDKKEHNIGVLYDGKGVYTMRVGDAEHVVSGSLSKADGVDELVSSVDGNVTRQRLLTVDSNIHVFSKSGQFSFHQPTPKFKEATGVDEGAGGGMAPMPGVVEKVCVIEGQVVAAGDPLVVIIAMKMEYVIKATSGGIVEKILHKPGESVPKDAPLVKLGPLPEEDSKQ